MTIRNMDAERFPLKVIDRQSIMRLVSNIGVLEKPVRIINPLNLPLPPSNLAE